MMTVVAVGAGTGVAIGTGVEPEAGVFVGSAGGAVGVGAGVERAPGVDVTSAPGVGVRPGWPRDGSAVGSTPAGGWPGRGVEEAPPREVGVVPSPGTPVLCDGGPEGVSLRGVILTSVALRRAVSSAAALMMAGLRGASFGRTPSTE